MSCDKAHEDMLQEAHMASEQRFLLWSPFWFPDEFDFDRLVVPENFYTSIN
jgi:hypothetical protein